jgi:hypothetical protein
MLHRGFNGDSVDARTGPDGGFVGRGEAEFEQPPLVEGAANRCKVGAFDSHGLARDRECDTFGFSEGVLPTRELVGGERHDAVGQNEAKAGSTRPFVDRRPPRGSEWRNERFAARMGVDAHAAALGIGTIDFNQRCQRGGRGRSGAWGAISSSASLRSAGRSIAATAAALSVV